MDAQRTKHPAGAVVVDGRHITAVGPESELAAGFRPRRVIDAGGAAVHPGFLDLHYHTTLHIVSKLLEEAGDSTEDPGPWAAARYTRMINAMEDEDDYASALLVCLDMLRNGYTAFMEPGTAHEPDIVARAAEGLGIRASLADPWLMDRAGPQLSEIDRAPLGHERCLSLLGKELWRNKDPDALVRAHVAIYGMGSQTDELTIAAKACADENGVPFNMHQSQSLDDADLDFERFGRAPCVHWTELGILDRSCVFVHMNVLHEEELQPIVNSGMSIAWCPAQALFYAPRKRMPNRIPELFRRGVNVTFGVDVNKAWTFGHSSLLGYMIAREEGYTFSPEDMMAMHTIGGARAMGLGDITGSLEPGKRADIVIRSNDRAEARPVCHVERDLMLHSLTRSVDTVIVDGAIVIKGGHHTAMDERVVYDLAQQSAERLLARVEG